MTLLPYKVFTGGVSHNAPYEFTPRPPAPRGNDFLIPVCTNADRALKMLSALSIGAELIYPENPIETIIDFLQGLEYVNRLDELEGACFVVNQRLYRVANCNLETSTDGGANWEFVSPIRDCNQYEFRGRDLGGGRQAIEYRIPPAAFETLLVIENGTDGLTPVFRLRENDGQKILEVRYPPDESWIEVGRFYAPPPAIVDLRLEDTATFWRIEEQTTGRDWRLAFNIPRPRLTFEDCRLLWTDGRSSPVVLFNTKTSDCFSREVAPRRQLVTDEQKCGAAYRLARDIGLLVEDTIRNYNPSDTDGRLKARLRRYARKFGRLGRRIPVVQLVFTVWDEFIDGGFDDDAALAQLTETWLDGLQCAIYAQILDTGYSILPIVGAIDAYAVATQQNSQTKHLGNALIATDYDGWDDISDSLSDGADDPRNDCTDCAPPPPPNIQYIQCRNDGTGIVLDQTLPLDENSDYIQGCHFGMVIDVTGLSQVIVDFERYVAPTVSCPIRPDWAGNVFYADRVDSTVYRLPADPSTTYRGVDFQYTSRPESAYVVDVDGWDRLALFARSPNIRVLLTFI